MSQVFLLLALMTTLSFPLQKAAADPRTAAAVSRCEAALNDGLETSDIVASSTPWGKEILKELKRITLLMPESTESLIALHQNLTFYDLGLKALEIRNEQLNGLEQLLKSEDLPEVFKKAIESTISHIESHPAHDREMIEYLHQNLSFEEPVPSEGEGFRYHAHYKEKGDAITAKGVRIIGRLLGRSRGFLAELYLAFQVPEFSRLGMRLGDLLSSRQRRRVVAYYGIEESRKIFLHDIDLVHGENLVEIKNTKYGINNFGWAWLIKKARHIQFVLNIIAEEGGPKLKMKYVFIRHPINDLQRQQLFNLKFTVEEYPDLFEISGF